MAFKDEVRILLQTMPRAEVHKKFSKTVEFIKHIKYCEVCSKVELHDIHERLVKDEYYDEICFEGNRLAKASYIEFKMIDEII